MKNIHKIIKFKDWDESLDWSPYQWDDQKATEWGVWWTVATVHFETMQLKYFTIAKKLIQDTFQA